MSSRFTDYGIADLQGDDIYNLLPFSARAADPGAIRTLCQLIQAHHNQWAALLRALPRFQDPTKAARFDPVALGEDKTLFDTWLAMKRRIVPLTEGEIKYVDRLATMLPKSIQAYT